MPREYRLVVEKIIPDGEHGPYLVTRSPELGVITLSLDRETWQEKKWPDTGTEIMLSRLVKKRAGWRAQCGRLFRPSDLGRKANSKENEA